MKMKLGEIGNAGIITRDLLSMKMMRKRNKQVT
jgi:hypothetical protein